MNQFYNSLWEQAAAQGITVILSSGDGGPAGCDDFNAQQPASKGIAVSGFASTPFNIAVGGTDFDQSGKQSLFWNTTNTTIVPPVPASALKYIPEIPWNDSCGSLGLAACSAVVSGALNIFAGSGGPSTIYAKPPWQMGMPGMPTDNHRDLPDVALFAGNGFNDSFYIVCQRDVSALGPCDLSNLILSFQGVGGTSVSAPAFAGIVALVNQKQATAQVAAPRQGNANVVLYALAKKQVNANPSLNCVSSGTPASGCTFNDLTKGNNAVPCTGKSPNCSSTVATTNGVLVEPGNTSIPAFPATSGYDLASGLGSVNAQNLVDNWSTVNQTSTSTSLTLNNHNAINITHGSSVPVQVNVTPTAATGDVSLIADLGGGNLIGFDSLTLGANGTATGTTTELPGGTNFLVHAHYTGDGTNAPSDSTPPVSVTVNPETSKTFANLVTLDINGKTTSFSALSATYGSGYFALRLDVGDSLAAFSPTTGIASKCASHLTTCPTGAIALISNGVPLAGGSLSLNSEGFAEDQSLLPGSYAISAQYPGDSGFGPSSSTADFTIAKAPVTIAAAVGGLPVQYGDSVEITADVTTDSNGIAPTGSFVFMVDGSPVGGTVPVDESGPYIPNSSPPRAWADAISDTTFLSVGPHTLSAQYSGDAYYASATSPASSVTVTQALPDIGPWGATPNSVNVGQQVTLSAQVFGFGSGVAPTGTIAFFDGENSVVGTVTYGVAPQRPGLLATMPYTPAGVGVHGITVSYSGDANYLPGSSPVPASLTVIGPDFTLIPQSPSLTVAAGSSAIYKIAVGGLDGFTSSVAIGCSVVAAATTCTSSPSSVGVGGIATITVTTTSRSFLSPLPTPRRIDTDPRITPLSVLVLLGLIFLAFSVRTHRNRVMLSIPAAAIILFLIFEAAGCGGGGSSGGGTLNTLPPPPKGTPGGIYTVTITGTSGATTHAVTTTLVVD